MLLTVPNQLGVAYNVRLLGALAEHVLPAIGWNPRVQAARTRTAGFSPTSHPR